MDFVSGDVGEQTKQVFKEQFKKHCAAKIVLKAKFSLLLKLLKA